jgi:hypothetical protein
VDRELISQNKLSNSVLYRCSMVSMGNMCWKHWEMMKWKWVGSLWHCACWHHPASPMVHDPEQNSYSSPLVLLYQSCSLQHHASRDKNGGPKKLI